jgi:hypothetical protein
MSSFVGDQEYYYESDQQDQLDQGKYSMRSSLLPIHFNSLNSLCMCLLVKDALVLILFLDSYSYSIGYFASAHINNDLVT